MSTRISHHHTVSPRQDERFLAGDSRPEQLRGQPVQLCEVNDIDARNSAMGMRVLGTQRLQGAAPLESRPTGPVEFLLALRCGQ